MLQILEQKVEEMKVSKDKEILFQGIQHLPSRFQKRQEGKRYKLILESNFSELKDRFPDLKGLMYAQQNEKKRKND